VSLPHPALSLPVPLLTAFATYYPPPAPGDSLTPLLSLPSGRKEKLRQPNGKRSKPNALEPMDAQHSPTVAPSLVLSRRKARWPAQAQHALSPSPRVRWQRKTRTPPRQGLAPAPGCPFIPTLPCSSPHPGVFIPRPPMHTHIALSPRHGALLRRGTALVGLALDAQVHDVVAADGALRASE
jgi:hypothetical protein